MDWISTWLRDKSCSENTVRAYRTELGRVDAFLQARGWTWDGMTRSRLARFRTTLERGDWHPGVIAPTASSLRQCRRIVGLFSRWAVATGRWPPDVLQELDRWRADSARVQEQRPEPVGVVPLPCRLLTDVDDLDGLAAALSFWTGAMPAELAALRVEDVVDEGTVRFGRAGLEAAVPVPTQLAASAHRLRPAQGYLFGNEAPATPAAMGQRVSRWLGRNSGGRVRTARALREQFIARARSACWPESALQAHLRRTGLTPSLPQPSVQQLRRLIEGLAA